MGTSGAHDYRSGHCNLDYRRSKAHCDFEKFIGCDERHSLVNMTRVIRNLRFVVHDKRGSSESALVLIPLLSLFLIISQVTIAIHGRNMAKIMVQDAASERALSGNFDESDTFLHIYSPDDHQNLDLVISHTQKTIPTIFMGLKNAFGGTPGIDVTGIAVIENQR